MNTLFFNWADYAIIGVMAFSVLISIVRGFVREALSLTTWIIAIWVGATYSSLLSPMLAPYIHSTMVRGVVAFFILFAGTLIIGTMASFLITQIVHKTGLTGTDRMLGIVFGLARGALVVAILLLIGSLTTMPQSPWWKGSVLIPHFKPMAVWLQGFFPASTGGK